MTTPRKFVLITGCSQGGIGDALAQAFAEKGYHVFATARNPSKISRTLSNYPHVTVLTLDVLSADAISAAVDYVARATNGRLDVLVNNSGAGLTAPGLDVPIEQAKKLFDLNLWAPWAMFQAFAPLLINAKGCLVNNSSATDRMGFPLSSAYNASKGALTIASETWRHELAPLGVRTVTIVTCGVKTNFFAEGRVSDGIDIPTTSPYHSIRDFILRDANDGRTQEGAMSPRQYALGVVSSIDGGADGEIWAGKSAGFARFMVWAAPRFALDRIINGFMPLQAEMVKALRRKP